MPGLAARLQQLLPGSLARRGRTPGLRTAKTTLAAVASFVIAQWLGTSPQPVLAPLTALLVVQLTMYETVAHGLERIASVLAGVLLAVGVASLVGLTWWSLGIVVALSLIVGRMLRLGPHLLEVPISAMLVLAVGGAGAESAAFGRFYETLIGAAVGIAVNLIIAPPLYLQPAGDAIADLAERMAQFAQGLGAALRAGWSRADADHWLNQARGLGAEVERADRTLERGEQSARLNPRGRQARSSQPRLRTAISGLEHSYVNLRGLCRALLDRTFYVPDDEASSAYRQDQREALADVLDAAAAAIKSVGAVAIGIAPSEEARHEVEVHLDDLQERRDRMAALLLVDPREDQGAWQQHGALLAAIDRLHVEVESAIRPPGSIWRPAPVAQRQREAVRRMVDAAAHAAVELQPLLPESAAADRPPKPPPEPSLEPVVPKVPSEPFPKAAPERAPEPAAESAPKAAPEPSPGLASERVPEPAAEPTPKPAPASAARRVTRRLHHRRPRDTP